MTKAVNIGDFDAQNPDDAINDLLALVTPEEQEATDAKMILAAKIYKAMKAKGWTQTQFAQAANQHGSVISKWLSGTHNFTVETLVVIQKILNVHLLDIEEAKIKNVMEFRVIVTSSVAMPEDKLHRIVYEAGGMMVSETREYQVEG
jgi:transcriptional regulator with XRE-family HTH domain